MLTEGENYICYIKHFNVSKFLDFKIFNFNVLQFKLTGPLNLQISISRICSWIHVQNNECNRLK